MTADTKFKEEIISGHAKCRKLHGLPPLTWDDGCQKLAEKLAMKLKKTNVMAHGELIHPSGKKMGQNLAMIGGTPFRDLPGDRATYMWYNECVDPGYTFGKKKDAGTGHFTQVVWRGSTHVGAARIKAGDKSFVVANYLPAGNFNSLYKQNVPQPLSGKLEKVMTEDMKKSEKFQSDHGGDHGEEGLCIRTSTSTSTKIVNGKKTVKKTVKTFHNDKCVKISVNGVDQPME